MGSNSSFWGKLIFKFVDLMDLNINEIEKIENRYKLTRKLSAITICPFIIIIIGCISILLYKFFPNYSIFISFSIFIIIASFGLIVQSRTSSKHNTLTLLYPSSTLLILFCGASVGYDVLSKKPLLSQFTFYIFWLILISLTIYAIYHIIIDIISEHTKQYNLTIYTQNGEKLDVKLLSITKSGDYIVEIHNNEEYCDAEILISRANIEKIVYKAYLNNDKATK